MFLMFALALAADLVSEGFTASPPPEQVKVVAVTTSSTMPKWRDYSFEASNLIDGRVDTSWQPAKKDTFGVGEWVELDLGAAYQIDHIEIVQGLQKVDPKHGDLFCRNNRFAEAYLLFDDGTHAPYSAFAGERVSKVELFYRGEALPDKEVRVITRYIRLVVISVHEPVDWADLAIADMRVFGRRADALPVDPAAIAWDQPGSYPFKAAITEFCAVKLALRKQRHCDLLVGLAADGRSFHDAAFRALPPIRVADRDQGKASVSFIDNRIRVRADFVRDANQRWSVTHLSLLDASGKAADPAHVQLIKEDRQHQNECWEQLGKKRPEYPPE